MSAELEEIMEKLREEKDVILSEATKKYLVDSLRNLLYKTVEYVKEKERKVITPKDLEYVCTTSGESPRKKYSILC